VAPVYPAAAVRDGVSGTVVIASTICGSLVCEVRSVSGPEQLISAAMAAAKRWEFHQPDNSRDAHPVLNLVFEFRLVMPTTRGTQPEDLTPVFRPPYTVEVAAATKEDE
jgi:hypothetical protein